MKLLDYLRVLARQLIDNDYSEETLKDISLVEIDLHQIKEELNFIEGSELLELEEIDMIRALLAYLLMRETDLHEDDIYSFIFSKGKQIIWN
ncbi:hypothetical protein TAGGR_1237 [Thermodesulfovibrio aggregans]|uniref:Uncharacterized protein n=1 Tax=Thermodesulfovibrio aggregans TaxID=86166 RepID=A0A0U9HPF6_9BACT|nr:hypothetical protein [Thermodesulfovibrio aggregans]GAQ94066.1 hypothetical protein TAGGR_1237 [Thermodesulfovibrio aggregans]